MDKKFKVEIYTPYGKYLQTESDYLSVSTAMGVIGVLPNHAPLISTLEISKLILRNDKKESLYAISGGVIHIKKDHSVILLVESIESQDEIDVNRALKSKERAEERLQLHDGEIDIIRAKASLARALNRIEVSGINK